MLAFFHYEATMLSLRAASHFYALLHKARRYRDADHSGKGWYASALRRIIDIKDAEFRVDTGFGLQFPAPWFRMSAARGARVLASRA